MADLDASKGLTLICLGDQGPTGDHSVAALTVLSSFMNEMPLALPEEGKYHTVYDLTYVEGLTHVGHSLCPQD